MIGKIKQAPIGYTGEVDLTWLDGRGMTVKRKTIKNNGVNNLFMLLCEFLNGSLTSGSDPSAIVQGIRNRLPRYLAIGSPTSVEPTTIAMTSLQDTTEMGVQERFPLMTNGTWVVDVHGMVCIQYSCNIPHSSVGNAQIKEMGICSSAIPGTNDLLARITVARGTENGVQIPAGNSLLVNWRIYFTNNAMNLGEDE